MVAPVLSYYDMFFPLSAIPALAVNTASRNLFLLLRGSFLLSLIWRTPTPVFVLKLGPKWGQKPAF